MLRHRKTKIVATLGPSSNTYERIKELHKAGVDVFRLNFSHGTHTDHQHVVNHIRQIEYETNQPISILADLQGPKLRIGTFLDGECHLIHKNIFTLDLNDIPGDETRVCLPHPEIYKALLQNREQLGNFESELLLDDGKIRLRTIELYKDKIITQVEVGGKLSDRKGVNVPAITLPISALTKKDHEDLKFVMSLQVDWIALSFVQRYNDILEVQNILSGYPEPHPKIISKIEKPKALEQLSEIIAVSDAIMIARGDLGVEMNPEEVPTAQKHLIRECREAGKPVIVATQMLESMIYSPSPTRAETSDVATAVYDGVDAVMLSAESASGQYPAEAVSMMHKIIQKVEKDPFYSSMNNVSRPSDLATISDSMVAAARRVAETIPVKAIVTFTETGNSTLREARQRPQTTIIGLTPKIEVARMMNLFWGTHPVVIHPIDSFSGMVTRACEMATKEKIAHVKDSIIILAGIPFGQRSGTNIMRIIEIPEE